MAVKVVHVSDISGKEADEQELGQLRVLEHPEYGDLPIDLEALPEEIEALSGATRYVTVEWFKPGARTKGERLTVSVEDFNLLAAPGVMDNAMQEALISKHRSRGRAPGRGRAKVNYATLEHAGEPHRGRITEAEKELVRDHLDEINGRLRDKGMRAIDPTDPEMRKRYGI